MKNPFWSRMTFDTGWNTEITVRLWGRNYCVTLRAKAWKKEDEITKEQDEAICQFTTQKDALFKQAERLLGDFRGTAYGDFTPRTLLFERDGSLALLCDDVRDQDGGVAVCLWPEQKVAYQDDYL